MRKETGGNKERKGGRERERDVLDRTLLLATVRPSLLTVMVAEELLMHMDW